MREKKEMLRGGEKTVSYSKRVSLSQVTLQIPHLGAPSHELPSQGPSTTFDITEGVIPMDFSLNVRATRRSKTNLTSHKLPSTEHVALGTEIKTIVNIKMSIQKWGCEKARRSSEGGKRVVNTKSGAQQQTLKTADPQDHSSGERWVLPCWAAAGITHKD